MRISLFASAIGDPWLGYVLAGGSRALDLVGLALASLLVYHGGMALNDWADREVDRRNGRKRPLTTGGLAPSLALWLAFELIAMGLVMPWLFGLGPAAALWIAIAALTAVVYDLWGRGPWAGPLLLATARGANLLFGAAAAGALGVPAVVAALVYAALVFTISLLGRYEDGEAKLTRPDQPGRLLRVCAWLLTLGPFVCALVGYVWARDAAPPPLYAWLGVALAWYLVRPHAALLLRLSRREVWTPAAVEAAMGPTLGSLGLFTLAGLCALATTPMVAGAALVLFALQRASRRLMRAFPPS